MTQKVKLASLDLVNALVEGILEKKGEEILVLDLKKLPHAIADYFIICEASNERQVNAIADQLEREVRKKIKEKPWHVEGKENLEWVLIDYFNVVVHIFKKETRKFYALEDLWADGEIVKLDLIENERK
jgi:ribosome-associated protein